MFDANKFKRSVKQWIRDNPNGSLNDMVDFCEDQIPTAQYSSYRWLVNQTIDWYKHILNHREISSQYCETDEDSTV